MAKVLVESEHLYLMLTYVHWLQLSMDLQSFKIVLTHTFPLWGATLYIAFKGDESAIQWC